MTSGGSSQESLSLRRLLPLAVPLSPLMPREWLFTEALAGDLCLSVLESLKTHLYSSKMESA